MRSDGAASGDAGEKWELRRKNRAASPKRRTAVGKCAQAGLVIVISPLILKRITGHTRLARAMPCVRASA